jgi:excisionase family DNA binding protein
VVCMIAVESVEQVAARLGCGRSKVFELLADGTLERAERYGRSLRILSASVDRALLPKEPARRKKRTRRLDPGEIPVARREEIRLQREPIDHL